MRKWGFYYYPNECTTQGANCLFQLVIHGCIESAEEYAEKFAPFASSNRMVMVFP